MKSFSCNRLFRLAQQSVKHFKLDLEDLSIYVPSLADDHFMPAAIAAIAGARNVFVNADNAVLANTLSIMKEELALNADFHFIKKLDAKIVSQFDCMVLSAASPFIDNETVSHLKSSCILTLIPENLDFNSTKGIDLEACAKKKITVAMLNPSDHCLMLYKYIANILTKRCYEAGLDVFRSKIVLVGSGEILETALSHLKNCGAQVYAAYTDRPQEPDYVLKHIIDADAIVIADYPQKAGIILGPGGIIRISDINDYNKDVKIIHISGKIDFDSINDTQINNINEKSIARNINLDISELGSRAIGDITAAAMKAVESLVKSRNNSFMEDCSALSYNIINSNGPTVLGRIKF